MPLVAILCEYPTLNGGERSMLSTLDGLRAAGFELVALAPPTGQLADALRRRGVEVAPLNLRDDRCKRLPQAAARAELANVLQRLRPALLHANSLAMGRLSGPVAAELGLPSIAHLRDIIGLSGQAAADLNRHARLLAVSQATRDAHVAQGLTAERVHVLYNGVDLERFQPRQPTGRLHAELGLPPDAMLAATIGQIGLRKGQDVLLRAAAALANSWPNLHYLIIGQRFSGKDESRQYATGLEAAAEQLGGRVHFLGPRDDVDRLLNELTLLAHPARQEPLGRVLLEAAAAGVPVTATDVGGTREIFPPEAQAALLVPSDDACALAAAIGRLVGDRRLRDALSQSARRRAEEAFDVRRAAAALVRHYQAVLD